MPPQAIAPEVPVLVLEASDQAPTLARRFLASQFREWGYEDDYIARVVVTELVTNAYKHGQGFIVVRLLRDEAERTALIEVWDQGPGMPLAQTADLDSTSGRGLMLMAELVRDWGTRPIPEGGKIIWARCLL